MKMSHPLVTVGVPVFNGMPELPKSLDSLLGQDHPCLEILISDNASTDGTEDVCRSYATRDPRIRYVRQPQNIGASRNFEFVAREARGDFFFWHAHDDLRMPGFASRCLAELQRNPGAVACMSQVVFLDEDGNPRPDWGDLNFSTVGLPFLDRIRRLYDHMDWVDMMGLMRRDALMRCLPFEDTWGADVLISAKLLRLGDFCKVEEPLFHYRVRSVPKGSEQTLKECFDEGMTVPQPYTEMARAWLRIYLEADLPAGLKDQVFADFVRTLACMDPQGPHPCWRNILAMEHPGRLSLPCSAAACTAFLSETLFDVVEVHAVPKGPTVEAHLARSAQTVLIGLPGGAAKYLEGSWIPQVFREALPEASITLLCGHEALELAGNDPNLDHLLAFDADAFRHDWGVRSEILALVRDLAPDLVCLDVPASQPIYWPLVEATRPTLAMAVGPSEGAHPYTHLVSEAFGPAVAGLLGFPKVGLGPRVWLQPEAEDEAEAFFVNQGLELGRTLALLLDGADGWTDGFADSLAGAVSEWGLTLLALGPPRSFARAEQFLGGLHGGHLNLCGGVGLGVSGAILRRCRAAVGPMDVLGLLAQAVGTARLPIGGGLPPTDAEIKVFLRTVLKG